MTKATLAQSEASKNPVSMGHFGRELGPGRNYAVVVVDFQNGFTDPASPLGADLSAELAETRRLLNVARMAGRPIIFTAVAYEPDGSDVGLWGLKAPKIATLVLGSQDAALDERLGRRDDEPLMIKKGASACFGTNLVSLLTQEGIDSVVLVGTSTSGCVRATAVDLFQYGLRVFIPAQAVGDRDPETHRSSLQDMNLKYADVISVDVAANYLTRH
ncbi:MULTISPECIES: isochorismatase family protein [Micrococcaceae]|jgi:nicotinamidase-related amidase|uniref:isochorismatase family protein n=1 Tax=Micrococcaceae TaxID=1268 RepID=UPI00209714CE|nr:isochorismatase family protein [Arthrobacter sp. H16F315]MDD1475387.1 isochorismatase family protein [Arthrobacter sp. H16F315]